MYRAPVEDIAHTLNHVVGLDAALSKGLFGDSAPISSKRSSPRPAALRRGDRAAGARWAIRGAVLKGCAFTRRPAGLPLSPLDRGRLERSSRPGEHGGQGLPASLAMAAMEMWNSGSLSFGLGRC